MSESENRQRMAKALGELLEKAVDAGKDEETLSRIREARERLVQARDESTWEHVKGTLDSTLAEIRKGLATYGE